MRVMRPATWQSWMGVMYFTYLKWMLLSRYECIPLQEKCSLQMLRRLGKRSCPAIQGRSWTRSLKMEQKK